MNSWNYGELINKDDPLYDKVNNKIISPAFRRFCKEFNLKTSFADEGMTGEDIIKHTSEYINNTANDPNYKAFKLFTQLIPKIINVDGEKLLIDFSGGGWGLFKINLRKIDVDQFEYLKKNLDRKQDNIDFLSSRIDHLCCLIFIMGLMLMGLLNIPYWIGLICFIICFGLCRKFIKSFDDIEHEKELKISKESISSFKELQNNKTSSAGYEKIPDEIYKYFYTEEVENVFNEVVANMKSIASS